MPLTKYVAIVLAHRGCLIVLIYGPPLRQTSQNENDSPVSGSNSEKEEHAKVSMLCDQLHEMQVSLYDTCVSIWTHHDVTSARDSQIGRRSYTCSEGFGSRQTNLGRRSGQMRILCARNDVNFVSVNQTYLCALQGQVSD